MYTSYTGLGYRSRSTTNVFRASSLDDASQPPLALHSTFSRNPGNNPRRRRAVTAPIPPQRSDSFAGSDASSMKRARSYLSHDVRRQFAQGFEASTPAQSPDVAQSPRSNNFVQKLVASLERKQREISGNGAYKADDEFYKKTYREVNGDEKAVLLESEKQRAKGEEIAVNRFVENRAVTKSYSASYSQLPTTRLENLQELEHEDDEEDHYFDSEDLTSPGFWESEEMIAPPLISINSDSNVSNDNPSKPTVRRTLKNMLSSIFNWKNGKGLPKGSREYYAARESLGEEMRAFRRDTMPRLIEHATNKSHLDHSRGERSRKNQTEFSQLIGSPHSLDETQPSIATIHPVYGTSKLAIRQHRLSRVQELSPNDDKPEVVYGSLKVQLPAVPLRAKAPPAPTSPPAEHLLLPSRVKDLQKRLSREADSLSTVQLRKRAENRASIVYDVPRSNARVMTPESPGDTMRFSPPIYENIGLVASDDKGIHCSVFTSF